jgi:hypothetical protein
MDIYGDRIKDIIPLLIKHKHFERAMLNVNRLYMPSYNGRQHGNHHMSALLFQKSLDIVKNNIEKQEE